MPIGGVATAEAFIICLSQPEHEFATDRTYPTCFSLAQLCVLIAGRGEVTQLSQHVQVIPFDPQFRYLAVFKPDNTHVWQLQFVAACGIRSHGSSLCTNISGPNSNEVAGPEDNVDYLHRVRDRRKVSFEKSAKFAKIRNNYSWCRGAVTYNACRHNGIEST